MIIKLINIILIAVAVFMGIKQGWAMISAKQDMVDMFGKWDISPIGLLILGSLTMFSAFLILFTQTFVYGNVLMASTILLIIGFHLHDADWKGVLTELPFFLLNLVIISLKYPLPLKTR
jgi:hypothetical protein